MACSLKEPTCVFFHFSESSSKDYVAVLSAALKRQDAPVPQLGARAATRARLVSLFLGRRSRRENSDLRRKPPPKSQRRKPFGTSPSQTLDQMKRRCPSCRGVFGGCMQEGRLQKTLRCPFIPGRLYVLLRSSACEGFSSRHDKHHCRVLPFKSVNAIVSGA